MDVNSFVQKHLLLLDKEREAEIEETQVCNGRLSAKELQRKGVCLLKMEIKSRRHGMFGRTIVGFEPDSKHRAKDVRVELPSNSFSPGDIVGVSPTSSAVSDQPEATGIVSQISSYQISLAFEESEDVFGLDDDSLFKLTKLANNVTYRRLKHTLQSLDKYQGGRSQPLVDIFFGASPVSSPNNTLPLSFVNTSLDESQKEAVRFGLAQKELAVIHGPPGTGKTTTVVELIIQAVKLGMKVLALAPSNIAVDNMVEKLANFKQKVVRLGHPARLLTHLQKYSLDALVANSEEKGLARDVRTDIDNILKKMKKARRGGERAALRDEMKSLQRELNQREKTATREVLSRADVVLSTLTSATGEGPLKHLKEDHFDLLVIDECSQAMEVACWIGLLQAPKCVLAGDHLQLPPTVLSKQAANEGLGMSLMERILNTFAKDPETGSVVRMLTTQYRMHSDIMTWASDQLYDGRLTAHSSVAGHLLKDIEQVTDVETTDTPLLLIDTSGCDLYEADLEEDISKGNEGEADVVAAHVKALVEAGVKTKDIAVISPYNLQIEFLRTRLASFLPDLEVKSVDGFQGREKEAVVISMVRSNKRGEVGFLAEKRRINVAVTRARRHLAVVCDTCTVSNNPFIKTLVDYMTDRGVVVSAHEFSQEIHGTSFAMASQDPAPKKHGAKPHKAGGTKPEPRQSKDEKMAQYEKVLTELLADESRNCLKFDSTLNSHDRLAIHEVAEKLGLFHGSVGEGKDRHIMVSKVKEDLQAVSSTEPVGPDDKVTPPTDKVTEQTDKVTEQTDKVTEQIDKVTSKTDKLTLQTDKVTPKKDKVSPQADNKPAVSELSSPDMTKCPLCSKSVSKANFDLHHLHCSRQHKVGGTKAGPRKESANQQPPKPSSANQQPQKPSSGNETSSQRGARKKESAQKKDKPRPASSKVRKAQDVLANVDGDDLDALLDSIKDLDSRCAFKSCKTLTKTLGRHCDFCRARFCLQHLMPEIHGCGDAAKEAARRVVCREGVLYRGSGVPSHKPSATQRGHLERRMEKKMEEHSQKRTRKTKES